MLENNIEQIKKTTLSQDIVQKLMELIINGTLPRGEKLPSERQLMEMFGVGRSSLREAIRSLTTLGLIEVRVPEGTFVVDTLGDFFTKHLDLMSKISFDNITELIEARIELEGTLVEMAARKADEKDKQRLKKAIENMNLSTNDEDFLRSDLDFHTLVTEIAKNSFLVQVMHILREVTREWIYKVLKGYSVKESVIEQHERIANAIIANDEEAARKAMTDHLVLVSRLLIEFQQTDNK
ncbi:GntR family transcriptional repressor for pyruvate dehydrogenase complex [Sporosarcina luteola]|nr:GntR family transcriptional repressor for pyruvate dehydrogenase complex [Sporosarcina luteola]